MSTLKKKIVITGNLKAITGLLIGGSNTAMGIGGPDKMVIRNPMDNRPYVPGSSLKGKMRSLLELTKGVYGNKRMGKVENGPGDDPTQITTVLFGSARGDSDQRPSRLIVRDGYLLNGDVFEGLTELPYTESKVEVVIDRITSAAMPRTFERVPAGAEFSLDLVLNIMDDDPFSEKDLLDLTFKGMLLIQDDYLGGSGSRGSGKIKFQVEKVEARDADFYHGLSPVRDITSECGLPEELS